MTQPHQRPATDTAPADPDAIGTLDLDDMQLHELMDRALMLCEIFQTVVAAHPAAPLFARQIVAANGAVHNLYEQIAHALVRPAPPDLPD